ncbi:MAG: 4Fe-4S dicluster domain-containing protein [Candidatus Binatia bacterium]
MTLLSKNARRHFPEWDDGTECLFRRVTIDTEACDGCKLCTLVCPANVLELVGEKGAKKARVREDFRGCISCNNCHAICATGAITATQPYDFVGYYRQLGRGAFAMPRKF